MTKNEDYRSKVISICASITRKSESDIEAFIAWRKSILKDHDYDSTDGMPLEWDYVIKKYEKLGLSPEEVAKLMANDERDGGIPK